MSTQMSYAARTKTPAAKLAGNVLKLLYALQHAGEPGREYDPARWLAACGASTQLFLDGNNFTGHALFCPVRDWEAEPWRCPMCRKQRSETACVACGAAYVASQLNSEGNCRKCQ